MHLLLLAMHGKKRTLLKHLFRILPHRGFDPSISSFGVLWIRIPFHNLTRSKMNTCDIFHAVWDPLKKIRKKAFISNIVRDSPNCFTLI